MTKTERLAVEAAARRAVNRKYNCTALCQRLRFGASGRPAHEFDIYADGTVIGGVSTSPLMTGPGSANTGGRDRTCAELLWLTLWPGPEARIHVLTDRPLAEWLLSTFGEAQFPHRIVIYHYDVTSDTIVEVGTLREIS